MCGGGLVFLTFDPETGSPTFTCRACGNWHVGEGCCFERTPPLIQWMENRRRKRDEDEDG